jgi:excisionase family DNA binding protein
MHEYFLRNLGQIAEQRAIGLRDEARLWDILARDLKREAGRREETRAPARRVTPDAKPLNQQASEQNGAQLFVRINEATKLMGISRSSLYVEIGASRIPVRKSGRKTLIAKSDIQKWFDGLPMGTD